MSIPHARPEPTRIDVGTKVPKFWTPLLLVAGSLVFAVFSTRNLWTDGMLAFGDLTRYPSDPGVFVDDFRQAWSDRGLGGVFPSNAFVLFPALLLVLAAGNETLVQQLHMMLWIPVAFLGMAYVCRRFVGASWPLAAIGGAVYVATPVSIGLFVAGAGGLIWSYALAPLLLAGIQVLENRGYTAIALFAAAVAIVATPSVELLAFGVLALLVWIVFSRDRSGLVIAGVAAVGLAIVTALPSLVGRGGARLSTEQIDKLVADFEHTYDEVTPQLLARLAGNQGDPMHALGYDGWESWTYAGYLLLGALVVGLVLRKKGDLFPLKTSLLAAVTAGLLLAIAFVAERNPSLFADFSPVLVFRNPEKLMILLAVATVPGVVYGLHRLFESFPQHRAALGVGVAAGLLAYFAVYASPSLSGHWGVATVRSTYETDDALQNAARYLKQADPALQGRWRVVWLPFGHTDAINLEWILPQWANEPVLERRDASAEESSRILLSALEDGDLRRFHAVADRASVRYVVIRGTTGARLGQALASDSSFRRIRRGKGFVIWRNDAALPRIRQFSQLQAVVATQRLSPVRYTSPPLLTMPSNPLAGTSPWEAYPLRAFSREGGAIRVRGVSARTWPVLARRIRAEANTSYRISAWIRTRNAADAHLKVIWYRAAGDPEFRSLSQALAQPSLSGNNRWTRVSGTVTSPPGTRFAEIAFLGGKLRVGSRRAATSWVRDIRVVNRYVGEVPATPTVAVADVIPDLAQRGQEYVEARTIRPVLERSARGVRLTAVIVNPKARGRNPGEVGSLVSQGARMQVAARATVSLQPKTGAWGKTRYAVVMAGDRGTATLPLGRLRSDRYVVSVTGCRLGAGSIAIVGPRRTLRPVFTGARNSCGRVQTSQPVALRGRTSVAFTLRRNASIGGVQATPVQRRRPAQAAGSLTITDSTTPSPGIRGATNRGITLADAHHSGWETSGSGSGQFRTYLGLNGFLVDEPAKLDGLSYGPQLTRDLFIVVSLLGWAAIVGLWIFYPRLKRARRYPSE